MRTIDAGLRLAAAGRVAVRRGADAHLSARVARAWSASSDLFDIVIADSVSLERTYVHCRIP
jgi:hypothetical protein